MRSWSPRSRNGSRSSRPASDLDSEEARFRLFDAVTSFLAAASRDRPLVLVLDDLHWADEPSLLLLKFAAREIASSGLLLVGTYRDVELGRHHPLAQVLGELQGGESGARIALRGIEADDVERYIELTAGVSAPPGLAAAVRAQTEGNPFFVGEVVRLLASEGRLQGAEPGSWEPVIPQGVREVVGRRLDRLSPETNEALTVAAAIGREFDGELVLLVAKLEPAELMAASREAIDERLVDEVAEGRFSFSHALVRETLYRELSPAQRSRLHQRIAEALEELPEGGATLGELAHHFLAAAPRGDGAKAVDYARRAAAQAMGKLAYEEAADLYSRALELIEMEPSDDELRCELRLELGAAQTRAGRHALARTTLTEAAEIARSLEDTDRLARAVLALSEVSVAGRVDEGMIQLAEEALERVGPEENGRRAALLSVLGQELYWIDAQGRSAPIVAEAIELARKLGDDRVLASALHRWIFLAFGPESAAERLLIADEMRELAEKLGDTETLLLSHAYRVATFLELGDVAALDREVVAYERCAEELRMPHHLWHVPALRAMRALIDGDLPEAERLAEEARAMGERAEQQLAGQFYGIQLLQLRRHQGRTDELIPSIRQLAQDFPAIPAWRAVLATLLATSGAEEEARLELRRLAADDFATIHRDLQWLPAFALLGETAALIGDSEYAELVYAELLPYDGKVVVPGRAAASAGPVGRVLGMLARVLGRLDDSERHLQGAIDTRPAWAIVPTALRPASSWPRRCWRAAAAPTGSARSSCSHRPSARRVRWARGASPTAPSPCGWKRRGSPAWTSRPRSTTSSRRWRASAPTCAPTRPPTAPWRSSSATSRTRPSSPSGSATSAGSRCSATTTRSSAGRSTATAATRSRARATGSCSPSPTPGRRSSARSPFSARWPSATGRPTASRCGCGSGSTRVR